MQSLKHTMVSFAFKNADVKDVTSLMRNHYISYDPNDLARRVSKTNPERLRDLCDSGVITDFNLRFHNMMDMIHIDPFNIRYLPYKSIDCMIYAIKIDPAVIILLSRSEFISVKMCVNMEIISKPWLALLVTEDLKDILTNKFVKKHMRVDHKDIDNITDLLSQMIEREINMDKLNVIERKWALKDIARYPLKCISIDSKSEDIARITSIPSVSRLIGKYNISEFKCEIHRILKLRREYAKCGRRS